MKLQELCGEALQGLMKDLSVEPLKYKSEKLQEQQKQKQVRKRRQWYSYQGQGENKNRRSGTRRDALAMTAENIRDMFVSNIMRESGLDKKAVLERLALKQKYEGRRVWFRAHGEAWSNNNVGQCLLFDPTLRTVQIEVVSGDRPPEVRTLNLGKTSFETWPERKERYIKDTKKEIAFAISQEEMYLAKAREIRDRIMGFERKLERLQQRGQDQENGGNSCVEKKNVAIPQMG